MTNSKNWAKYLELSWATDTDGCEECDASMGSISYVRGDLGHYCSTRCRAAAEGYEEHDHEAKQLGFTAL